MNKKDQIKQYYNSDRLNQSRLSSFEEHPSYYFNTKEEDYGRKDHFILGGLVDCMITTPDIFDDLYIVNSTKLAPQEYSFINLLSTKTTNWEDEDNWIASFKELDIKRPGYSVFKDKLTTSPKYEIFFKLLVKAKEEEKEIVTKEEKQLADKLVKQFKENNFISKLVTQRSHYMVFTQVPIYFSAASMNSKALLDFLIVDTENRKIYPVDLKTTSKKISTFLSSFKAYKYDIQAAFYTMAVDSLIHKTGTTDNPAITNLLSTEQWVIEEFQFIVIDTMNRTAPQIFRVSKEKILADKIRIIQLIKNLFWHIHFKKWDYHKEVYDNNGVIEISNE